ncbi:DUF4375 domain-containing protein [Anatilimnocola sp. NA78]|uniref:DMP19 family protein n=1 Tax=Anatilimnocola sp. NA78 TaxID=3415683 RepID=UPI003CE53784
MPWNRKYLRDLLYARDPIEAVFELASIWSSRPGRKETDAYFGLLPCQYTIHLFLNYQGDVGNGGHSQFFMNPVGAYANETLEALKELRLQKVHGILSLAIAAFPGSQVPKDWKDRNDMVEGFTDEVLAEWSRLDRELYSVDSDCWPTLQRYLQDHESEILERDGG